MAGNTKDIKTRIKAVENTQKVTKSMKLLSQIKLQQVNRLISSTQRYISSLLEIARKASYHIGDVKFSKVTKLFRESTGAGRDLIVVISADKGLCGAFNNNIYKYLGSQIEEYQGQVDLITIGRKVDRYARKLHNVYPSTNIIEHIENAAYDKSELGYQLYQLYLTGEYRSIHVVYTQYISAIRYENRDFKLFPLDPEEFSPLSNVAPNKSIHTAMAETVIEPSPETALEHLIPLLVEIRLQEAINNARASEMASRVAAMSAASDNANKLIGEFTRKYNKARQANITQEISEIVVGVESMKS